MCPTAARVSNTVALSEGVGFARRGLEARARFDSDGSCLQGPGWCSPTVRRSPTGAVCLLTRRAGVWLIWLHLSAISSSFGLYELTVNRYLICNHVTLATARKSVVQVAGLCTYRPRAQSRIAEITNPASGRLPYRYIFLPLPMQERGSDDLSVLKVDALARSCSVPQTCVPLLRPSCYTAVHLCYGNLKI